MPRMGFHVAGGLKAKLIDNRRRVLRRACDLSAWIRSEGSIAVQECRVVDLSQTGVRLSVVDANKIANRLILFLTKNGAGRYATVRWRRGTQIGAEI
jgi:hypothetical protein